MCPGLSELTESQWQSQVIHLAKLRGWAYYHTVDSRKSNKGFPDLVLVRERVIYVELKTEKGRVRPEQQDWFELLALAGQEVYLWRPSDVEIVDQVLGTRVTFGPHINQPKGVE
jgi:hypothetical protein